LAQRDEAASRLREHFQQFDWAAQSPGRRAALQAFLRLANEYGFHGVTMRLLAKELNIKAPSLYAHFPNGKDEIVAEALRWQFAGFGESVLKAVAPTSSAEEFWNTMVRVHVTQQIVVPESNLSDLLVATDALVHFLSPDVRRNVDLWNSLYEDMYAGAAADMGIYDCGENIRIVLAVLEQTNRWCDREQIEGGVAKAIQVSHQVLRLPALHAGLAPAEAPISVHS
jgi:AcrR family transcriptional regulator